MTRTLVALSCVFLALGVIAPFLTASPIAHAAPSPCLPEPTVWVFEDLGLPVLGDINLNKLTTASALGVFTWLFYALMALTAVLSLVVLAYAGISYITSEVISDKAKAKAKIYNAILGLILAMASVLILYQINPQLTTIKLPALPPSGTAVDPCPYRSAVGAMTELCNKFNGELTEFLVLTCSGSFNDSEKKNWCDTCTKYKYGTCSATDSKLACGFVNP